ncbi:hypothetical protein BpHYR1_007077 [Brachionus plicatilis]|uniref:Uncharacterized protein n=1 Tax=Brachionus plicatilis TaxID=10195 RepID=A0A3M7PL19_BRAPC|nr:hypothetical protein BpHYR1_007077 [Brachionus plicatilis]
MLLKKISLFFRNDLKNLLKLIIIVEGKRDNQILNSNQINAAIGSKGSNYNRLIKIKLKINVSIIKVFHKN